MLLFGCTGETAILIEVTSPLRAPEEVDALRFEIYGESSGTRLDREFPLAGPFPHSLSVRALTDREQRVIAGGDETPVTMPRTAFQLVYPDGTVMLDAGMDKATHDSFGEGEPFYADEFAKLQHALNAARLILLSHYHADHVAGVLQAPNFAELASKTIATTDTIRLMMDTP